MPWTKTPVVPALIRWGLLALALTALIAWLHFAPHDAYWSPQRLLGMRMPEPEKITQIERVEVECPKKLRVIPKKKVEEIYHDLPTPPTVANDNAWVTAVCDIPAAPAGGTAVSVLTTGKDNVAVGHIEFMPKKTPLFALQRVLGLRGGVGTGGRVLGEAYAQPVRVGPVFVELRAFAERDDRSGADFGAAILLDVRY